MQLCSDVQIRVGIICISLKVQTVNPAALRSDQNLSFVSGRVLKSIPSELFLLCHVPLQCGLACSSQGGVGVHFCAFWTLGWTCDLFR